MTTNENTRFHVRDKNGFEFLVDKINDHAVEIFELNPDDFDDEDSLLLEFSMKWDGCHNFKMGPANGNYMHGCEPSTPELMKSLFQVAFMMTGKNVDEDITSIKEDMEWYEDDYKFTDYDEYLKEHEAKMQELQTRMVQYPGGFYSYIADSPEIAKEENDKIRRAVEEEINPPKPDIVTSTGVVILGINPVNVKAPFDTRRTAEDIIKKFNGGK